MDYSVCHCGIKDWISKGIFPLVETQIRSNEFYLFNDITSLFEVFFDLSPAAGEKLFNLSATKIIHFGRILHKHQIPSKRTQTGTVYHVVEK